MLRFGTDGIRGDADADLPSAVVRAIGCSAAHVLGTGDPFLIGRDTRRSGARIEVDLIAGLESRGAAARSVGVLPTPGTAYLAANLGSPAAVISASHNPFQDNGIKFFDRSGNKLDPAAEAAMEAELLCAIDDAVGSRSAATALVVVGGASEYVAHLVGALEGRRLDGMRVVVDAANGAASEVGPAALRAAGAAVEVINASPDGTNINAGCGSTHPEGLQAEVVRAGVAAGLAFDGDADRVIAVDERGGVIDGDQIMAMVALDLQQRNLLRNDAIVVTVMSNLGLRQALSSAGIGIVETNVGDRNVLAAMHERGLVLGGEQSGHVIFGELATTGDGVLTGLMILDLMARSGRKLSDLAAAMTKLPQVLESVKVSSGADVCSAGPVRAAITRVEGCLGDRGRVLVRPSGTEPVIRVMAEAPTHEEAAGAVAEISDALAAVAESR